MPYEIEVVYENSLEDEKIQHPHGIALRNGEIFVSDQNQHRLIKLVKDDQKYHVINVLGSQSTKGNYVGSIKDTLINFPGAILFDEKGRLIVSDAWNDKILMVDFQTQTVSNLFVSDIPGTTFKLKSPRSMILDREGKLIVMNCDIQVVMKLDLESKTCIQVKELKTNRSLPTGLAIDQYNNIFHTGTADNRVYKMDSKFNDLGIVAGCGGHSGPAEGDALEVYMLNPSGLAFDSNWDLYISESSSIKKLDMKTNKITTLWSDLGFPLSMAFDRFGNLYFTEYYGHKITKLIRPRLPWNQQRIIWIGHSKNPPSTCLLAKLPHEMIKEILSFCRG